LLTKLNVELLNIRKYKRISKLISKTSEMSILEKYVFISLIYLYKDDLANNHKNILISELQLWKHKNNFIR